VRRRIVVFLERKENNKTRCFWNRQYFTSWISYRNHCICGLCRSISQNIL